MAGRESAGLEATVLELATLTETGFASRESIPEVFSVRGFATIASATEVFAAGWSTAAGSSIAATGLATVVLGSCGTEASLLAYEHTWPSRVHFKQVGLSPEHFDFLRLSMKVSQSDWLVEQERAGKGRRKDGGRTELTGSYHRPGDPSGS